MGNQADRDTFDSWKEIAAYLKRTEKTCRRWEKELGLPIHRLEDSPRARVFAYKDELDLWIQKTSQLCIGLESDSQFGTSIQTGLKRRQRLRFFLASIGFGILVTILVVWHPWEKELIQNSNSNKARIAILDFDNISKDEDMGIWRTGLCEILSRDLSQSEYLQILSRDETHKLLSDLGLRETQSLTPQRVRDIANTGRTDYIVTGRFRRWEEDVEIVVDLLDSKSGQVLTSLTIKTPLDESVFERMNDLSRSIRESVGEPSPAIDGHPKNGIKQTMTRSVEAFQFYLKGSQHFEKEEFDQSIENANRAIALDPEFSRAYLLLAWSYHHSGRVTEYKMTLQKAMDMRDQLSQKDRLRLEGDFGLMSESTFDKAISSYRELLRLYPDELSASVNLGAIYLWLEEWDQAVEIFRSYQESGILNPYNYGNLAWCCGAKGWYQEAHNLVEDYLRHYPDDPMMLRISAEVYLWEGAYAKALMELEKIKRPFDPNREIISRGKAHLVSGNFEKAEEEFNKLAENKDQGSLLTHKYYMNALFITRGQFQKSEVLLTQALSESDILYEKEWLGAFQLNIVDLLIRRSKWKEALQACDRAYRQAVSSDQIGDQRQSLSSKGLVLLEMGLLDEAEITAAGLKDLIDKGLHKKSMRLYYHLMGALERKRGNLDKAADFYESAIAMLPYQTLAGNDQARYLDPLASTYYEMGDLESSQKIYEKIMSLGVGRMEHGDIYAKAFYMLGKIQEDLGLAGESVGYYRRFLELWKDSDPGIPEVERARRRVAELDVLPQDNIQ